MSVSNFDELLEHVGHKIVCVAYRGEQEAVANVAIECETCNQVLVDYDRQIVDDSDEIHDHLGTVTKGDFLNDFREDFVDEHFDELAHSWFKGLSAQIDFGILLECVKDEYPEGLKEEKNGKGRKS